MKEGGSEHNEPRCAIGTSIFFESDIDGEYTKALKNFCSYDCNLENVRYLGPLENLPRESDDDFNKRMTNVEKRQNLGVIVKNYPLKEDSFRFLVVNQKYVSIEFPTSIPLTSGWNSRSVVAVTFENGFVGSMLHTIFENMWQKAIDIEKIAPHKNKASSSSTILQIATFSRWTSFSYPTYDFE